MTDHFICHPLSLLLEGNICFKRSVAFRLGRMSALLALDTGVSWGSFLLCLGMEFKGSGIRVWVRCIGLALHTQGLDGMRSGRAMSFAACLIVS